MWERTRCNNNKGGISPLGIVIGLGVWLFNLFIQLVFAAIRVMLMLVEAICSGIHIWAIWARLNQ